MKIKPIHLSLFIFALAAACTPQSVTPSAQDIQTAIALTEAANPPATPVPPTDTPTTEAIAPSPSSEPSPSPSPTAAGPISGKITVAFLNLRTGPSTLHDVIQTYEQGQEFNAIARVPTSDWVEVLVTYGEGGAQQGGWMYVPFIELDDNVDTLPVVEIENAQIIKGRVQDTEGQGINDIGLSVTINTGNEILETNLISSQSGDFLIYLPLNLEGTLDVQIVSVGCDSRIMSGQCEQVTHFLIDWRLYAEVPYTAPIIFTYEEGSTFLTGTVEGPKERKIANAIVYATRDDGAFAFAVTDAEGAFVLPIGEGIWEVYAVNAANTSESQTLIITIVGDQTPDVIELVIR